MKKLFLIPLLACFTCVMAWGATVEVATYDELRSAVAAADNGDVIKITADMLGFYQSSANSAVNITKSITIDGQGHTLYGYGRRGTTGQYPTIAINHSGSSMVDVTLKNLQMINPLCRVVETRGNIHSLTIENCHIEAEKQMNDYDQPITIGGNQASQAAITIKNSKVVAAVYYPIITFNPVHLTLENTDIEGWCSVYFKGQVSSAGSRGSVVEADGCHFDAPNVYSGETNAFGMFVCEDDGVSISLNNCGMAAEQRGDQRQAILVLSNNAAKTRRTNAVSLSISGDNTYINGALLSDCWSSGMVSKTDYSAPIPDPHPLSVTISGGTYAFNPEGENVFWYKNASLEGDEKEAEENKGRIVIPDGYEVKTVETTQAGETKTLYRVREIITTPTSTDINENLQGEGDGQNDDTNFKITTDQTVSEESVIANYIELSEDATLTIPEGKTLEVTNGLDVTDGATLDVAAGSTLVVGEGGVTSENTGSIVIESNENGSASFLLSPEVIVNTTPNLTVKMTVKGKGYKNESAGKTYYWHRFAAPVVMAEEWSKAPSYGTWLYGWDYTAEGGKGAWAELASSEDMVPFQGYTLSPEHLIANENEEIVYSFKGQLAGNQNMNLQFNARGFNFFGNSYTGYIDVLTLVDQLMGNENIDGSVYMWNNGEQGYEPVSLQDLKENPTHYLDWQKEIAPMQTFILRQINTGEDVSTLLNYENSIWKNPRYGNVPAPAPAPKRAAADADPFVRVMITAANGQNSQMSFAENADRSDDFEKGYDALKYMNENTINVYSTLDGQNLANVATNDLEGKTITLQTNDEIAYTMSFLVAEGEEYAIRDNATGKVIAIEEGATYEFAAQPNSTVEGRFEIVAAAKMPTAIENTEVKANAKGIYTLTGQYLGEDFEAVPAGVYVVNGVKIVK